MGVTSEEEGLEVRFPLPSDIGDEQRYLGYDAYWTNRPDCVSSSRTDVITSPPVEGEERWLVVVFDMACLLG
jgi:hypothetical protein